MNNKVIKIVLLSLAIIAICVAVILTQKSIDKFAANQTIQPFDFVEYIKQKVDSDISGTAVQARIHYVDVYDIITTEKNIKTNTGSVISATAVRDCYEYAFRAYWNIYNKEVQGFFSKKQREWSLNKRNEILRELNYIVRREGCSQSAISDIEIYEKYIKQYRKALDLVSRSNSCEDYESYKRMCNECSNYKDTPYSNATELQSNLDKVPLNAQESWKAYLINEINTLIAKDFSQDINKENFQKEYNNVAEKVNSYKDNLSKNDKDIENAMNQLGNRSRYWTTYFINKLSQNQQNI